MRVGWSKTSGRESRTITAGAATGGSGGALGVLGKRDEALHEVEAMVAGSSLASMPYLRDAACFRDLHAEPRYQKAVQKLQARIDTMRERLPATLAQHGFTMDQF